MMFPKDAAELAELIRGADGPLAIQGGGTRGVTAQGSAVSTAAMSGVELYEPGALTLVAKAGTPVAEVEQVLAAEGQRLAFEPMDHRGMIASEGEPTIGGVFAGNISGPRRIQAGAARDFALGVRFVDGAGRVIQNGGRVMKNVTGYDLVKLLCGSWGTLGVLTEISLKTLPVPETEATLVLPPDYPEQAIHVMSWALGSPFDVTGAAYVDRRVHLRLEGFADSVAYRQGALMTHLRDLAKGYERPSDELTMAHVREDAEVLDPKASSARWAEIRDVTGLASMSAIWKVSVKPSDALPFINALERDHGFSYQLDWGGGLVWIGANGENLRDASHDFDLSGTPESGAKAMNAAVQEIVARIGGHATLVKAPKEVLGQLRRFQPESSAVAAITHGLRQKFDPRSILNPGVMG